MTLRIMLQAKGHRSITVINHPVTVKMLDRSNNKGSWLDQIAKSLAKDRTKIVDLVDNYGKIVKRYSGL